MSYVQGTVVRIKATVQNTDTGVRFDPPSIRLIIDPPGEGNRQIVESEALAHGGLGLFHYDVDTELTSGVWRWEWDTGGATAAVKDGQFTVRPRIAVES